MRQLSRLRRERPELGWGTWQLIETRAESLFVHRCDWQESTVIAAHNLGPGRAQAKLTAQDIGECEAIDDLFEGRVHHPRADGSYHLALDGFRYPWLRPRPPRAPPPPPPPRAPPPVPSPPAVPPGAETRRREPRRSHPRNASLPARAARPTG